MLEGNLFFYFLFITNQYKLNILVMFGQKSCHPLHCFRWRKVATHHVQTYLNHRKDF